MPSGNIAFPEMTGAGIRLLEIDITNRTWGRMTQLPVGSSMPFKGSDELPILYSDGINLTGYSPETGETVSILSWVGSGISPESVIAISLLENERIVLATGRWHGGYTRQDVEIAFLSWNQGDAPPDDRILLTLSTLSLDSYTRETVMAFNRASSTHHIQVKDYSEYNIGGDYSIGRTRLTLDLTTGNIPDLLDVSVLPLQQYAARGLLEDLYPFLDADPEFGRDDLMESILKATEIDGAIYRLFPQIGISTLVGHPSVVGSYPGWNMDEFITVLNANPGADLPVGQSYSRMEFLSALLFYNIDDYIDWASGTASFDSDDFISLLQALAMLPMYGSGDFNESKDAEMIAAGRQIVATNYIGSFLSFQTSKAMFGGEFVFKGYPAVNRNGNTLFGFGSIAITTTSENKDAAWEFIKSFLTVSFARRHIEFHFPLNKTAFFERLDEAMIEPEFPMEIRFDNDGFAVPIHAITQQEADQILDLFARASDTSGSEPELMNIVNEGATDFFNGLISAHEAAGIIQNRASRFIAEQAG
jgi:hypothetical protein